MHIRELGLQRSVADLVKDARSRSSGTQFELDFDSEVVTPDDVVANTIYRAVQESLTNIFKHAHATTVRVRVGLEPSDIVMSVVDDGIGFAEGAALGRGLTGMRERVRALGGAFSFRRIGAETVVSCTIPVRQAGDGSEPS